MNKIINKFSLAGDTFMPEMRLRKPGFTYIACVPCVLKTNNKYKQFKETGDSKYIYKNELDKACFQHDMAYGEFKDLLTRTVADKVLHDKPSNIAKTFVDVKAC